METSAAKRYVAKESIVLCSEGSSVSIVKECEKLDLFVSRFMQSLGYPADLQDSPDNLTYRLKFCAREMAENLLERNQGKEIEVKIMGNASKAYACLIYPGYDNFDHYQRGRERLKEFTQITGKEFVDKTTIKHIEDEQNRRQGIHAGLGCYYTYYFSDFFKTIHLEKNGLPKTGILVGVSKNRKKFKPFQ
jgi:hypothetical protein